MTAIRTPDQRLRIFVSSTMKELAEARAAAKSAIERLRLIPVLFELGARPYPPRELYLAYLRQSDVFLGIYGEQYGWIAPDMDISGLEDEYLAAGDKPKLVYVQSPAPNRDPRLAAMLDRIRADGLSYRGFARPDELAALVADDLALLLSERFDEARPPTAAAAPAPERRWQRPVPTTRFVGRQREVAALRALLTEDGARLVTLVGPGGIGKTRLALEVAAEVEPGFDRVAEVELAEITSADLVTAAVASALGVPETAGRSIVDGVVDYLRSARTLLLVDNFEHVMAAANVLAHLLTHATTLTLLVTSRERLRLSGERMVEVPPLRLPADDRDPDSAWRSDAVELFLDRARSGGADLHPDGQQMRTISEICRRLDGLPLAIELAANRVRLLGPDELLHRLDRRLGVLTSGPRDLPARQRALRSTMAWSYDLLDEAEQRLFTRLGVFVGDFSLPAAEEVCADEASADVLDGIASLVDKTLVRAEDPLQGQPRFSMLQVVREFALERLEAAGEAERLRDAHAGYFERLVIAAAPSLRRGDARPVIARLLADQANIRAAMQWSLETGQCGRVARMARALGPFWWLRSQFSEGIDMVEQALLDRSGLTGQELADAQLVLGLLSFGRGDYDRAEPALRRARALHSELGDVAGATIAAVPLGVIVAVQRPDQGEDLLVSAAETFRSLDDPWGRSLALLCLGGVLVLRERFGEAIAPLEESVVAARSIHADLFMGNTLVHLGLAHLGLGDIEAAQRRLREAVLRAMASQNRESIGRALDALAGAVERAGNAEYAAALMGAADAARRAIGIDVFPPDRARHDETARRLRAQLGEEAYRAATERGAATTVQELLDSGSTATVHS